MDSLFNKYQIDQTSHPYLSPMDSNFSDENQNKSDPIDITTYLSIVGSLIHAKKSRPEITYSVNRLSRRAKNPTQADYNTA